MGGSASAIFDVEEIQALKLLSSSKRVHDNDVDTWELLFATNLGMRRWLAATPAVSQVKVSNHSLHLRSNNPQTFNFQRLVRKTLKQLQLLPVDIGSSCKSSFGSESSLLSSLNPRGRFGSGQYSSINSNYGRSGDDYSYSSIQVQNVCNSLFLIRKFSQYFIETCDGQEEEIMVHFTDEDEVQSTSKSSTRLIRDLLLGLMDFVIIHKPNVATYDLHVEINNLLLVLLSTQMYHPLELAEIDLDDSIEFNGTIESIADEDGPVRKNDCHVFLRTMMEIAYSDGLTGVDLSSNNHDEEEQDLVDIDLDASIGKETGVESIKKSGEGSERSSIAKKTMLASAFIMALLERIGARGAPEPGSAIMRAITARNTLANEYNSMTSKGINNEKSHIDVKSDILGSQPGDANHEKDCKTNAVKETKLTKRDEPSSLLRLATDLIVHIPMRLYEYFFPSNADACPLSDRSMLLLCTLVNNYTVGGCCEKKESRYNGIVNPFRESFINIGDDHKSVNGIIYSDYDEGTEDIYIPRTSFEILYQSLGPSLKGGRGAMLLYTLLSSNARFKDFVLARDDLDTIVLPILETIYHASKIAPSHLYVLLILLLILSEDVSFNEGAHKRITVGKVLWFKEYRLNDITLGSLMLIMVLRTLQYNHTSKHILMDTFVHENCYAILSNMSTHIRNMHPYGAQRLMSLLDVMNKRYRNLLDRHEVYESENNLVLLLLDLILTCIQPNVLQHNLALMYALLQRQQVIKSLCSVDTANSVSNKNTVENSKGTDAINDHQGIHTLCVKLWPIIKFFDEFVRTQSIESSINTQQSDSMSGKEQDMGLPSNANTLQGAVTVNSLHGDAANDTDTREGIMRLLEIGQRKWYKAMHQHGNESVYSSRTMVANIEKYMYEEVENPENFFLPYVWSMIYDTTPDIWWDSRRILLFPLVLKEGAQ